MIGGDKNLANFRRLEIKMGVYNESVTTRMGMYGLVVDRVSDTLPVAESYPIFNVVGGRVAITQIIGEVTVAIQNQANNTKLKTIPTDGTAVDLCSVLNIANDEVGTLYGITGTVANAMTGGAYVTKQAVQIIVGTGTIDIDCVAENSGEIKWTIYYIAMDDGAYITAADPYVYTTTTTAGA